MRREIWKAKLRNLPAEAQDIYRLELIAQMYHNKFKCCFLLVGDKKSSTVRVESEKECNVKLIISMMDGFLESYLMDG